MAATNFTPIQLYRTSTASAVPLAANLLAGELAINLADVALFAENSAGTVTRIMNNPAGLVYPTADGTAGQVISTNGSGVLSFAAASTGTVTSVALSGGTTGLTVSGSPITTSGTITLAGTLAVANGGTGITSFGTGVATFLGTPSSANLAAAVTDETGTGVLVFATSPTLVTPTLGAASATSVANGLGAVGTPSYTFTGDLNTGMWSPAADTLAFSTNGAEVARLTSAGYLEAVYSDEVVALGNSGTATSIDLRQGNVFTATLTGNCTFTLTNSNANSNRGSSFTLILTNDATAGRTVAWAGGTFRFPGGAATLGRTTTANAVDIWVFFTPNNGTTYYGNISMKNLLA